MKKFDELIEYVVQKNQSAPKKIAVAAAGDSEVLETVKMVNEYGLGSAVLIGDHFKIERCAEETGCDLQQNEIIHVSDDLEAAAKAVEIVRNNKADIIMKGLMLTPVYLKAILNSEKGLKKGNFLHLATLMEIPNIPKLIFSADMGMVIQPSLEEKAEMIKNIALACQKMGVDVPKAACLGAIETVNPKMQDSMDAAVLSKMSERGQLGRVIVDGPLSFDLACFQDAVKHKGVTSRVAGDADMVIMPQIQAGNIFYKAMVHAADAKTGTVIMGTSKPAVMTSRSDSAQSKLNSIALALLLA